MAKISSELLQQFAHYPTYPCSSMDFDPKRMADQRYDVRKGQPWPKLQDGRYMYALTREGVIKLHMTPNSDMCHAYLTNGIPVITAGTFEMKEGEVVQLSNRSGRYQPAPESVVFAKQAFELYGATLSPNLVLEQVVFTSTNNY